MCVELKIKIKSLAEEAKIIRKEEHKLIDYARRTKSAPAYKAFESIQDHRKGVVRTEARATHLAYSFIRGKKNPENNADYNRPEFYLLVDKVAYMVAKYSSSSLKSDKLWEVHYKTASKAVKEEIIKWILS